MVTYDMRYGITTEYITNYDLIEYVELGCRIDGGIDGLDRHR